MIRATYSDFITTEDGRIVRHVVASWGATRTHGEGELEVYRMDDEGHEKVRCLAFMPIGGYMVEPQAPREWAKPIMNCNAFRNGDICYRTGGYSIDDAERDRILAVYPDFKWTLQKDTHHHSPAYVMRLLIAWKKDNRTELLVGAHLDNLVANGNFLRMKNERQKAVLAFIRSTPGAERWTLNKVLFVMNGHTPEEYNTWICFRGTYGWGCAFDVWKYLDGDAVALSLYCDYIRIAESCGHDIKDRYWKFPKDLKKAHDKVMKEYDRTMEARRLAEKAAATKREKEKKKNFEKVAVKWSKKKVRKNGMVVAIPGDIQTVRHQAKKLHQCLETCDYIGKMAERRCLLVFITTREGAPVATAEILPSGKVGQFYGDEGGRNIDKMKPGKKAQEALDAWLKKFKPKWRKAA